jgi:hypothetical protein
VDFVLNFAAAARTREAASSVKTARDAEYVEAVTAQMRTTAVAMVLAASPRPNSSAQADSCERPVAGSLRLELLIAFGKSAHVSTNSQIDCRLCHASKPANPATLDRKPPILPSAPSGSPAARGI